MRQRAGIKEFPVIEVLTQMGKDQFHLGLKYFPLVARCLDDRSVRMDVLDGGRVSEHIAGDGLAVKLGVGNLGQHDFQPELVVFPDQQTACLGHAFDDEAVGHDRIAWEVIVKIFLGQGDILNRPGHSPTVKFNESINPIPPHVRTQCLKTGPARG